MEYNVDYLSEKHIVLVKMKGRLNYQMAEKYSREAVKLARQNNCAKFLFDHTETTMQGAVTKIHVAGEELQQFGFKNTDRIAVVIANVGSEHNLQESENHNSRWCVLKYFSSGNMQEASNWLLGIE